MDKIKKIGIVGFGKMGQDIFASLHDLTNEPETQIVIMTIEDTAQYRENIIKKLDKALKRKKISEEVYNIRKNNFVLTSDKNMLSECDFIIEAIFEDIKAKKELFAELDSIVKTDCIFATNTSSLPIKEIFSGVKDHGYTGGVHFFYPVKLSGYIEFNDISFDDKTASDIAEMFGNKDVFRFYGRDCFYFNQFISFCISHGIRLKNEYGISISKAMDVFSELFPIHNLFGMADSIGLGLLTAGDTENFVKRIKGVMDDGRMNMNIWLDSGCPGTTGEFLKFMAEYEKDIDEKDISKEDIILEMTAPIINEAVYKASECKGEEDPQALIRALADTIGLDEPISSYYKKYGYDTIHDTLESIKQKTGLDDYTPADRELYKKFFD